MQLCKQSIMWRQQWVWNLAYTGQELQLMFKSNDRKVDKCDLSDFDHGMAVQKKILMKRPVFITQQFHEYTDQPVWHHQAAVTVITCVFFLLIFGWRLTEALTSNLHYFMHLLHECTRISNKVGGKCIWPLFLVTCMVSKCHNKRK